ncbi:cache domain-containing protein [Anaerobaca lacustris]|uniref:histidine kinase n=1 Tax=Anaerobaca lacustris TaxID=3044600 RepID=A0AAW6TY90_9BACT|nr:cache domain-containing protein [Sedimentisphaerales bacterium M17dextr]
MISFFVVVLTLSVSIALLGYYVIEHDIFRRTERKVLNDLKVARMVYTGEIDRIGQGLRLVPPDGDLEELRHRLDLHYLRYVPAAAFASLRSDLARLAAADGRARGGTRRMSPEELDLLPGDFAGKRRIQIKATPMAGPTEREVLDYVMAKEYVVPVTGEAGRVDGVLYGGRIVNRDYTFVDRIRDLVYSRELYRGKPVGTVTIFQDDVRISTNVLDENGQRAIGTRVSAQVYEKVVKEGQVWHDRAFVVTDWYKTAYEPIRDIEGEVIGILYVGTLEQPFSDTARQILLIFLAAVGAATVIAVLFSFVLAGALSKPLTQVVHASECLASGDWGCQVNANTSIKDINSMAEAFNAMAIGLKERQESLRVSNEKLAAMNKSYVDLIGFVAHELKGILASAVMNAYAVRDGYLGMVNFKQRKALDSVARNLDYLDATVKKFLNLGRVERGELEVHKTTLNLKKDVFDASMHSLAAISLRKKLDISNEIDPSLDVQADADLMQIVANNLVSNAIKYSPDAGRISVTARPINGKVEVDVYNDSTPISEEQRARLFQKFSRLDSPETKKVKGTGLGLYITKQIIERHGGSIRVEPREHGNSFVFQIERN